MSNSNKNTFGNMIENLFNKESKPVSKKKTTKKSVKKKATTKEIVKVKDIRLPDTSCIDNELVEELALECLESAIVKEYTTGAPSKYNPELHIKATIIALSQGKSLEAVAIDLKISWGTLHNWMKLHPEFLYAVKQGQKLSEAWWMEMGRLNLHNKDFNNTLYMMNMQNRFGWSRKLDASVKSTTHNINEERTTTVVKVQSDDEMAEVLNILLEQGAIQLPDNTKYIPPQEEQERELQ